MLLTAMKTGKKLFRYSVEIKDYSIEDKKLFFHYSTYNDCYVCGRIDMHTGELYREGGHDTVKIDYLEISDGFKKNFKVLINHPMTDGKSIYKRGNEIETED